MKRAVLLEEFLAFIHRTRSWGVAYWVLFQGVC